MLRQFAVLDSVASSAGSDEQLCVQLWTPLRTLREEPHERVGDRDRVTCVRHLEELAQRGGLELRIIRAKLELGELELGLSGEQVVQPLARRVQLEPKSGVRRHECSSPAVLLDPQL